MGRLSVPDSGKIYIDTQILIYTIERHPLYAPVLESLWQIEDRADVSIVCSELVLLEAMVQPLRREDKQLVKDYEQVLLGSEIELLPITQPILREAAQLRASVPALRTPDALHAATALVARCDLLVTNDRAFSNVPGLAVTLLDDVRNQ